MAAKTPPLQRNFELNNNEERESRSDLDIVSLLQLKEPLVGVEDQLSHASSLESIQPRQGSNSPPLLDNDEDSLSGSTSCSESSFEMASTSSFSEEDLQHTILPSISLDSFKLPSSSGAMGTVTVRESINREVNALDTGLPQLNFCHLEQKLCLAKHEQVEKRKQLGEEVRKRLALQANALDEQLPSTSNGKRSFKSFLGQRLQAAMQLQVCYMNELSEGSDSEDDEEHLSSTMRPSKSVPDFKEAAARARTLRRSAILGRRLTAGEREDVLRAETLAVQAAASAEGKRTVDELREDRKRSEEGRMRHSRQLLSRMNIDHLREIYEGIEDRIDATNAQLVSLLIARDSLHMERDSILVDIGDVVEGHRSAQIDIPKLLRLQNTNPKMPHDISTPK